MHAQMTGVARRLVATAATAAMATAGLVAGTVTAAHAAPVNVTTTLTDAAGNVLDGQVRAYLQDAEGNFHSSASQQVADGVVNLPVEPGVYKFEFSDDERLFASEYYNDKATLEAADPVTVAGPTALATVSLAPAPALTGQILSPTGKGLESASVTIYKAEDGAYVRSTNSRADGSFAVGLTPGTYKLKVVASGMAAEFYNNKATLETADVITVGAGGANVGQITMSKGSVVTGRITSAAGVPLERAQASLVTSTGSRISSDLTDGAGVYRIERVPAGTYSVQFSDPVGEFKSEWFTDKATLETADPVAVGVKAVVSGIDAALEPAPSTVDPAEVDISGVVRDSSGAPVMGAMVEAFDTPAGSDKPKELENVWTNRAGQYAFTRLDLGHTSENSFKLMAQDSLDREEGQYVRLPRWFGGQQSYATSGTVAVPMTGADFTLPLTGGISGTITSESALPIDDVRVEFRDQEGAAVDTYRGTSPKEDGTYLTTMLVPGKYTVRFVDYAAGRPGRKAHAPEWWDNTVLSKAKVVTVASGATTAGINAALGADLSAVQAPSIKGQPYLGKTLRATAGQWSVETGTTFDYAWVVGTTVIGTGTSVKVPASAKNQRISLRVTASNNGLDGTAVVSTQVIKKKPKVKIAVKGKTARVTIKATKSQAKKIKGTVVVKRIVGTNAAGEPIYKSVGKSKLKKGKASIKLKKVKKGKNKLVFIVTFKGGKYGDIAVTKSVKIKR